MPNVLSWFLFRMSIDNTLSKSIVCQTACQQSIASFEYCIALDILSVTKEIKSNSIHIRTNGTSFLLRSMLKCTFNSIKTHFEVKLWSENADTSNEIPPMTNSFNNNNNNNKLESNTNEPNRTDPIRYIISDIKCFQIRYLLVGNR